MIHPKISKFFKFLLAFIFAIVLFFLVSHFLAIREKQENGSVILPPKTPSQSVIFLGDIMLDREVRRLMDENGYDYPFSKIKDFLTSAGQVVANLESPVVQFPQETPISSMQFNIGRDTLQSLKLASIGIVSLANNHTADRGQAGLRETRFILNNENISHFGDPITCEAENIHKSREIVFIGLNKTFPFNCANQDIADLIGKINVENPDDFIMVFIHWGNEYENISHSSQRELAYLMIDSGADLIIGSHPHVVQEIEEYKNKLVFYSLGNFVFDQYFSEETQKGLAVKMTKMEDQNIFELFPIRSEKSQARLMTDTKKSEFLTELAEKSSINLKTQIESGTITLIN